MYGEAQRNGRYGLQSACPPRERAALSHGQGTPWVLWTDYFKPPHFEKYPNLNELFNQATKLAGAGGTKGTVDVAVADQLLGKIDEISEIFWETKKA